MTVASIRLHNGQEVSVNFGNNDGTITQEEIDAAIQRLEARMAAADMPGTEYVDHNSRIRITEGSATTERSADTLVRNGAVRLFGNNPMRAATNSTGTWDDNPALWHPVGVEVWPGGDRHTLYREVDRWDPATGQVVTGRTVRITEDGSRYILTQQNGWRLGTTEDHIPRLSFLSANDIDGLRGEDIARFNARGTGSGEFLKIEIGAGSGPSAPGGSGPALSRTWVYDGLRTEGEIQYHTWHDPSNPNFVARNRTNDPAHTSEINRAGGRGMWLCPVASILAPTTGTPPAVGSNYVESAVSPAITAPLTIRTGSQTMSFTLSPRPPVVEGGVRYDVYEGTSSAPAATATFRRLHGDSAGWAVSMNEGEFRPVPADSIVNTEAPPNPPPARPRGRGTGAPRGGSRNSRAFGL